MHDDTFERGQVDWGGLNLQGPASLVVLVGAGHPAWNGRNAHSMVHVSAHADNRANLGPMDCEGSLASVQRNREASHKGEGDFRKDRPHLLVGVFDEQRADTESQGVELGGDEHVDDRLTSREVRGDLTYGGPDGGAADGSRNPGAEDVSDEGLEEGFHCELSGGCGASRQERRARMCRAGSAQGRCNARWGCHAAARR